LTAKRGRRLNIESLFGKLSLVSEQFQFFHYYHSQALFKEGSRKRKKKQTYKNKGSKLQYNVKAVIEEPKISDEMRVP
jgi:hypothetical protein